MSSNHQSDLYCQYQIFWSPLLLPPFVPKFKAVYIYIGIQNKAQTWLFAPVCHRFFVKAVLYKWILTTVGIKLWIFKCPPVILFFGRSWELKCLWARVATAFKRSVREPIDVFACFVCLCFRTPFVRPKVSPLLPRTSYPPFSNWISACCTRCIGGLS